MSSVDKFETTEDESTDDTTIIYITVAVIVGLFILWLCIVFLTGEDPIKILNEMSNISLHITPANDSTEI
jgi:hypothetical protein